MESLEELTGGHDFDVLRLPKVQEVRITRHDVVSLPLQSGDDELVVGRIPAYPQPLLPFNQDTRLGKLLKQVDGFFIRHPPARSDPWVLKDSQDLLQDGNREDEPVLTQEPWPQDSVLDPASDKHGRSDHIGVEDRGDHARRL